MSQPLAERAPSRPAWRAVAARPWALPAAALIVLVALVDTHWKADPDSLSYLSMARSMAAGHGLRRLGLAQWYYAPLYPVTICPAFRTGPRPFLAVSTINVLTAWAFVLGTFAWFRRYSRRGAGLVAALVGVNVGLWDVCREPRAETLFSALLVWSAYFLGRAADDGPARRFQRHVVAGTVLLVATCLARQVGIFLAAGFGVAMLVRWAAGRVRSGRVATAVATGLLATIVVGGLVVHERVGKRLDNQPDAPSYTDQFRQGGGSLAGQVVDGFRRQTSDVGRLMLPGMWGSFAHQGQWLNATTILYLLFAVPVAVGWWRLTRRTADPLLWTVPFYGAMFTLWPFDQGTRFNVPLLPVLWASAWAVLQPWLRRRPLILTVLLLLHLLVGVGYLARDRGIVAKSNRPFAPLTELSRAVNDPAPMAAIGTVSAESRLMAYLVDRPVRELTRAEWPPGPAVRWLLLGLRGAWPVPAGFETVAVVDGYRLCRRSPSTAAVR